MTDGWIAAGGECLSMAETFYHLVSEIQRYPPFTEEVTYVIVVTYTSLYLEYPFLPCSRTKLFAVRPQFGDHNICMEDLSCCIRNGLLITY